MFFRSAEARAIGPSGAEQKAINVIWWIRGEPSAHSRLANLISILPQSKISNLKMVANFWWNSRDLTGTD